MCNILWCHRSRETKIDDERYANPEGFKTEQKGLAGHKGAFTPGDDKNKETMWKKADYHEWVMTRVSISYGTQTNTSDLPLIAVLSLPFARLCGIARY